MAKLLNTTLLVTMSRATPEGAGYGNVYASGSKIYFTSSLGLFDLTDSKGYTIVREYVTNTTWSPPANVKYVKLLAISATGGAGGGAKHVGTASQLVGGGVGSSGAQIIAATYDATQFTRPIYSVTIGGKGTGGAGNSSAAGGTGGNGGTAGGTSLASGSANIMIATVGTSGGQGGPRGLVPTINAQTSIPSNLSIPRPLPYLFLVPYYGGATINGTGLNPAVGPNIEYWGTEFHAMNGLRGMGGGGAGGGFSASVALRGGSGSGVYAYGTLVGLGTPGLPGTGNAGSNGQDDLLDIMTLLYYSGSFSSSYGVGSGGCGGGAGSPIGLTGGGAGGNAGSIGAGAGGGGAATGSLAAGKGGDGSDGYLAIIEFY